MLPTKTLFKLIGLPAIVLLSGCAVDHDQIRQSFEVADVGPYADAVGDEPPPELTDAASKKLKHSVFEKYGDDFTLAHIEFDDQGRYWQKEAPTGSDNQLEALEAKIAGELKTQSSKYKNGVIMITFVHGWSNNATEGNGNLNEFRRSLAKIAKLENQNKPAALRRPVIGVYLSWRGARYHERTPLDTIPKLFSYWDRKETAENIGRRAMGDTLKRISLLREKVAVEGEGTDIGSTHSYSIIIGHSFGAAAVFSGVSSFFEHELADAQASGYKKWVSPNWNLVVLVNPAFEALQYATIHNYASRIPLQLAPNQSEFILMPRLLVVASEGDGAVGKGLPLGQTLGDLFRPKQDKEQRALMKTGLGHYAPYNTHRLISDRSGKTKLKLIAKPGGMDVSTAELQPAGKSAFLNTFSGLFVDSSPAPRVLPFMVATADKSVISNHNDIWKAGFRLFLEDLIRNHEEAGRQALEKHRW